MSSEQPDSVFCNSMSTEEIKWDNNKSSIKLNKRQKRGKKIKNKRNRKKGASKMANMNPIPSTVILMLSAQHSSVNTQRSSDWMKISNNWLQMVKKKPTLNIKTCLC